MSKIIDKAFDATKKIFRSIFMGSPNLITAPDLNRQIEALKFQLDQLDDKVGVYSDFSVTHDFSGTTLTVTPSYNYLQHKGCSFSPAVSALTISLTRSAPVAYLCLTADSELVTYDTDFSHDIAGAKFEDGTSMAAANQMVYKNEQLILSHTLNGLPNLVAILAEFRYDPILNDVLIQKNTIAQFDSVRFLAKDSIMRFSKETSLTPNVQQGTSYDEAFSTIESRFNNLAPTWRNMVVKSSGGAVSDSDIRFRILHGILYFDIPKHTISRTSGTYGITRVAYFPSDILTDLISIFTNKMQVNPSTFSDSPTAYGEAKNCFFARIAQGPAYSQKTENMSANVGTGSLYLTLIAGNTDDNAITDICISDSLDYIMYTDTSGDWKFLNGPVNWSSVNVNTILYINRQFSEVPLLA